MLNVRIREFVREMMRTIVPTLAFAGGEVGLNHWRLYTAQRLQERDRSLPRKFIVASLVGDTAVILLALIASFWIRFETPLRGYGTPPRNLDLADYTGYIIAGTFSLVAILALMRVYDRHSVLRYRYVARRIAKSTVIWTSLFIGVSLFFKFEPTLSRMYALVCALVVPIFLLAWRTILSALPHQTGAAMSLRQRLAFVGWNASAARLARSFAGERSAYEVVGCLSATSLPMMERPAVRHLGHVKDIEDMISRLGIDLVVLTDVSCAQEEIIRLSNVCERELAQFMVVPTYFEILVSGLHLESIGGIPVLGISRLPLDQVLNIALKRAVDIVGALVGLFFGLPLIGFFGLLVYLESPGPIIYRQRRCGYAGRPFSILKIRSMKLNADAPGKAGWTTKEDPRRLRIGALLRRWNIDELPQFWNVLKGDMSLVGPRPEQPHWISSFKYEIPHYNARHNAKPGITGWAQVNGLRGDTDLTERIKCDLWYLENWSLWLDLQIMVMTFIGNKNAC